MNRILLLLAVVALGLSSNSVAQDIDLYLTAPSIPRDDSPNVMLIIDNSGSMSTTVDTRDVYDPTIDYSLVPNSPGVPDGRIYWSTSGAPPDTNSKKWFSATKNNCRAASASLDTNGTYSSDPIAGYVASGNNKGWTSLFTTKNTTSTDALVTYVECQKDKDDTTDPIGYARDSTISPVAAYTTIASEKLPTWGGFTTPTLYTSNYMNYWHNPTILANKTRLKIAQETLNSIIASNENIRFGLMTFNANDASDSTNTGNHGGRVLKKIDTMTAARRTDMTTIINNMTANGMTPLAETMWESSRYLGGKAVDYGDNTTETPLRDTSAESGGNYISPFSYACQQAYIIYVTDGDPTDDTNADSKIGALSGISSPTGSRLDELAEWMYTHDAITGAALTGGTGGRRTVTYTISFGTGISAAGLALLQSTAQKGGGLYSTANDADQLTTAIQAALIDVFSKTTSFAAPSLSVNAFNKLFNRDEVYFALFKPLAEQRWDGNIKKYTLCNDATNTTCTFGEILDRNAADAIDPAMGRIKDSASSYWGTITDGSDVTKGGAGANIPAPTSRTVYTYTGSYPIGTPVDLSQASHVLTDANAVITATMLGLPTTATATDRTNLINWIRGQDIYDTNDSGTTTDQRWDFGDPIHSRPVAITFGGTAASPVIKLFVGTNDGVIRMINESTGQEEWAFVPQELLGEQYKLSLNANGKHMWGVDGTPSFWIIDNNNNGVIEPENVTGKQDKIYMFIGMRRGGRNIYAFDITPSSTLTNSTVGGLVPKLMWVKRGGTDSEYLSLGETWSRPQVARIRFGSSTTTTDSAFKTVLMFAGGYDPHQDSAPGGGPWVGADSMGNAIYIVDPLTGERLWWASNTGSGATLEIAGMDFSIPSDLALMDPDGDGAIDRVYVGDTAGQIWRIDLAASLKKNSNGTGSNTTVGFRFADVACPTGTRPSCTGTVAQDRRKFFYPPDVTQVDDSTYEDVAQSKYDLVTIVSGDREDPLDLLTVGASPSVQAIHNRVYAFRDRNIYSLAGTATASLPTALTENDLYDASDNNLQVPDSTAGSAYDIALNGNTTVNGIKDLSGWYINLWNPASSLTFKPWLGEKGLAKTVIFDGTLYVTTFLPTNAETITQPCSPNEGQAFVYSLNMLNGTAIMDNNGDNQVTTDDRKKYVGGGIPSELVTVIREGGTTALVGTSGGAASPKIDSDLPRFKTYWYEGYQE